MQVADIKRKVEEHNKPSDEFEVSKQKLIYNGKILEDTQTVGQLNIDEKKFVVVMLSRVGCLIFFFLKNLEDLILISKFMLENYFLS